MPPPAKGLDGAVARAKLYVEAGADAIFPEALNTAEMFRAFAERMPGVPLLANMTEFGKTPFFTAAEFEQMGYAMVIWPVSSLRVANKAQQQLYAAIARDGGTHNMIERMQTRAELYDTIGLHDYEALDHSIVQTIVPAWACRRTEFFTVLPNGIPRAMGLPIRAHLTAITVGPTGVVGSSESVFPKLRGKPVRP